MTVHILKFDDLSCLLMCAFVCVLVFIDRRLHNLFLNKLTIPKEKAWKLHMIESPKQCHKVSKREIRREGIKIPIFANNMIIHRNAMKNRQVIKIN